MKSHKLVQFGGIRKSIYLVRISALFYCDWRIFLITRNVIRSCLLRLLGYNYKFAYMSTPRVTKLIMEGATSYDYCNMYRRAIFNIISHLTFW
ncbi:hypothetical protein CEB3_c08890 [Peptococcaceae bacterium CEB3]|nr:hypothetical protein CEB3_c08890 [Peptococcaceae bacterium CEB3]